MLVLLFTFLLNKNVDRNTLIIKRLFREQLASNHGHWLHIIYDHQCIQYCHYSYTSMFNYALVIFQSKKQIYT